MGPVNFLKAKLDIYRLEQRYTKGRDKRTQFVSNARYVDGEYIYDTDPRATDDVFSSSKTRKRQSAFQTSSSRFPPSLDRSISQPIGPISSFLGTTTTISAAPSPASIPIGPLSPATTSSSGTSPPPSAGSSPLSRSHQYYHQTPVTRETEAATVSSHGFRGRLIDHESYTSRGSGLGLNRDTPFSGDADDAWAKLPEERTSSNNKRKSVMNWIS